MAQEQSVETRFYRSYVDDFVVNDNQEYQLADDYVWIKKNKGYQLASAVVFLIGWCFSFFYCTFVLHMMVKNKKVLRSYRQKGYFLYGNHTQPVGDVFAPARVCGSKRFYSVASPANLGVPVIGKILPMLGALPIPKELHQLKKLWIAIRQRIAEKNCVVIYPEAHVWPYYIGIRPFPATSFRFPVDCCAPVFCMTTTYQKRLYGKKPKITVYVDGPFLPDEVLPKKEQQKKLCDEVQRCMEKWSKKSTYEYIHYEEER